MIDAAGLAVPRKTTFDDLLAVDRVVEGLAQLQVLSSSRVVLLLRVRVEDEVGLVDARHLRDVEAGLLQRLDRRRRHVFDRVDLVAPSARRRARRRSRTSAARSRRPAASARRSESLRWKSAIWSFLNFVSVNGPGADDRARRSRTSSGRRPCGPCAGSRCASGGSRTAGTAQSTLPAGCLVVDDERVRVRRLGALDVRDQARRRSLRRCPCT